MSKLDNLVINNNYKDLNKSAYFICHGGLGDLFINSGAIRFLSYFYNKIYLFCPLLTMQNLKILFNDLVNIEFINYNKWYSGNNTNDIAGWPSTSNDSHIAIQNCFKNIDNYQSFDWKKYISYYQDLSFFKKKEDAWHHWKTIGKNEGRQYFKVDITYELFDWKQYITYYQDLSFYKKKEDAWQHWIIYGKNEGRQEFEILHASDNDVFVNGFMFDDIISNKITHTKLIKYCKDKLTNNKLHVFYDWIKKFYEQINLDLTIYYNYFYIFSTNRSLELYNNIKSYKLVFLHFMSSCGKSYLPDNEWPHIYGAEYLIINPDKNHYDNTEPIKYNLANQYLNLLVLDYVEIILHATDIYVCDSCFANLVYPLRQNNLLDAEKIIIYDRYYPGQTISIHVPVNLSR